MSSLATVLPLFERLIGFDTTSRNSNLQLIEWVEGFLAQHGVTSHRVPNADGSKTNLFATVGPQESGGVILSGHSDVVPIDGQQWTSDPWNLSKRDGRYYGRGTCDMKGFIALALAHVELFRVGKRPVHLAISYDEEVGCQGAPAMIDQLARQIPPPMTAVVGEPTLMQAIDGHKGISTYEVEIVGHPAHSSLPHIGLSANHIAIGLMSELRALAASLEAQAGRGSGFDPDFSTLTIGIMQGGTAANILAGQAGFTFDLRCLPGDDAQEILTPFFAKIEEVRAEMQQCFPSTDIRIRRRSGAPPLTPHGNEAAVDLVRRLTGQNTPAAKVSFAAEAGQFGEAGFPTVICGPGSIEQAHQPDEWIAVSQMEEGARFMQALARELAT